MKSAKRDFAFVSETGQHEDIAMVTGIQRSLHSEANESFTFGHYEPALVHFHKEMAARLAGI